MDRIMVRISSGRGSLSRALSTTPRGTPSVQPAYAVERRGVHFQTFLYLLLALCGTFLVGHFIYTASDSSRALRSSLRSVPNDAIFQAQLSEKDKEIEKLRWEIEQIRRSFSTKDMSVTEAELLITQLRSKAALEHDAKMRAELALTDRAVALRECQTQKTALAGEVAQCHFDLKALLGGQSNQRLSRGSEEFLRRAGEAERQERQRAEDEAQGGGIGVLA